jgi:hypothetical protein
MSARLQEDPVFLQREPEVYEDKNASIESTTREVSNQEKPTLLYVSDSYQKILDYHIVEILLSTIVIGVVVLLRMHH